MTQSSETVEHLASAVRRFVREELLPAEPKVEEDDDIPEGIVRQLKELGLFGMTIPEEYGGLGLSMYEEARVVFEIGYASPVFRSYFGTSNGVGTLGILIDGTEEQRKKYLPRIATGELVASFCLTEPDAGSDAAALSTRAVRARRPRKPARAASRHFLSNAKCRASPSRRTTRRWAFAVRTLRT